MKITEMERLRTRLDAELAGVSEVSVALSGSMARGDYRAHGGQVLSDLDLIPVIRSVSDVGIARNRIGPVLRTLADEFELTCTAAITLADNFLRVRNAAYVTSMSNRPFLCDPLRLQDELDRLTTPNTQDAFPWLVQPVTYYLAKAGWTKPEENLGKALTSTRLLISELAGDDAVLRDVSGELPAVPSDPRVPLDPAEAATLLDDCVSILTALTGRHEIDLLPSSREFLRRHAAGDAGETIFLAVREQAFLENQGLPFEKSSMAARPTSRC
ncbi:hypothetical protein OG788_07690 [Streptomyces sp. NBC_00647]|uniref:hypothetical protein n=1 Tax=Streptomyces sp. NBC_00647 TaxID=2975796 RepID=UPI003245A48C